jgi:3-methyladenine DNA glycosylase AlkD
MEVSDALRRAANPDDAAPMAAYMRHVAPFLGVKTPARRAATKGFIAAARRDLVAPSVVLRTMNDLYALAEREFAYLAIDLFQARVQAFDSDAIVHGAVSFIDVRPWWDTVDALRAALGTWIQGRPDQVGSLTEHLLAGSMWCRRVAITVQLGRRGETDQHLLAEVIRRNLDDTEFFIRKAIGWALRDYAKTDPEWVRGFLDANRVTGLAYREATKHM